ncbi:universal stress protein [Lentilactobacillus laojiaonis]|uniref:universal stress protein n=1 Tax=Lentilactobacillus laojiaonis TaxID=2883998 RepID=UPI001D09CF13|nr:universal stress protein [Lentilactobacillus laojiaonis]UDM32543.1 universal stress protein [Lentilactobacillus laojiaonis]
MTKYTNILVGIDGSEISELALNKAIKVAKENKSKLLIASVINERDILGSIKPASVGFGSVTVNNIEEIKERTENMLNKYLNRAKEAGVEANTLVSYGNPKVELATKIVEENQIDAIFIGATGVNNVISRLSLGSTAEFIIAHALVDVLVVHK